MNAVILTSITDLHMQNRAERRRLFFHSRKKSDVKNSPLTKQHNKLFAGQTWAEVNARVTKMVPYVNPNPKVFKYNNKKRPN